MRSGEATHARAARRSTARSGIAVLGVAVVLAGAACDEDVAARARRMIREVHVPAIQRIVRDDIVRHRVGVRVAAARLAPGFVVSDPSLRERQMRTALKFVQEPPRGIGEFVASPMSFLAAVGSDGKVIARDATPDRMRGSDFAERFPAVRSALVDGRPSLSLGDFPSGEPGTPDSVAMLFTEPARGETGITGAVVAGIPLWRMAQRLGRQLQVDNAGTPGLTLWVYLFRGDTLYHFATPPEVDVLVPDAATRRAGLSRSPGGFTGYFRQGGRSIGWGVVPLSSVGVHVGAVVVRADPP